MKYIVGFLLGMDMMILIELNNRANNQLIVYGIKMVFAVFATILGHTA